jgi:hypothetical protein
LGLRAEIDHAEGNSALGVVSLGDADRSSQAYQPTPSVTWNEQLSKNVVKG